MAALANVVIQFPEPIHQLEDDIPFVSTWDDTPDSHLVVRETPPWQVRERWASLQLRLHELFLERELCAVNVSDHFYYRESETVNSKPILHSPWRQWLDRKYDELSVQLCRMFHADPTYKRGDQVTVCPTCGRKYAAPWADRVGVDKEVYIYTGLFVTPIVPTRQAECRNGVQRIYVM